MKTEEVKALLDAFYAGETTVKQEQELLHYFKGEHIAEELQEEKEVFLEMFRPEPVKMPVGLEVKLNRLIDDLSEKEKKKINLGKKQPIRLWITGIAASVLLLVTSGFLWLNWFQTKSTVVSQQKQLKGVVTDPKVAKEETRKALLLVSIHYNKGMDQLAQGSTSIQNANELINQQLKVFKHEN